VTDITGSQQWGILPVAVLFALGLILLVFVTPDGKPNAQPVSA